jgi:E3 ubiquitin-protein ligase NRDP1
VNEELLCSICMQTLRDPLADPCEHMFCRECIVSWLRQTHVEPDQSRFNLVESVQLIDLDNYSNSSLTKINEKGRCPVSGHLLQASDLLPVPRIVRNLLSKLQLSCEFQSFGCVKVCSYEQLQHHETDCAYDPNRLIRCDRNCGATFRRNEHHDCIAFLLRVVRDLSDKVTNMASVIQSNQEQINLLDQIARSNRLRSSLSIQNLYQI